MDNGFYATLVEGAVAQAGITVIEDNRIRGGDAEFCTQVLLSSTALM